jgi:hypothetical protein
MQPKEAQLKEAFARLSQYRAAEKLDAVKLQLHERGISKATIGNWLRDPPSVSKAYRWRDFVQAVEQLPDLEREKRNSAYNFALGELGLRQETQSGLVSYHGNYYIYHDFRDIELNAMGVRVESNPIVATFLFRYRNPDDTRGQCDGLIVERRGRLMLTGFSPTTVFQAVILCTPYPEKNVMRGMAFVEDLHTNEVYFSRIALLERRVHVGTAIKQQIDSHIQNSFYSLSARLTTV